ncbi:MAG: hypothetical protein ACRC92_04110 [Peptostreptococcaceae bacterium]
MIRLESIKSEFITSAGELQKRLIEKGYETEALYVDIDSIVYAQSISRCISENGVCEDNSKKEMFGVITYLNGESHGVQHKNATVTLESFEKLVRAVNCAQFGLLTKNSGLRVGTVSRGDMIETHIFNVFDVTNVTPNKEFDKIQIFRSWLPASVVNNNSYIKVKDADVVLSKDIGKTGMSLQVFNELLSDIMKFQSSIMNTSSNKRNSERFKTITNNARIYISAVRRTIMDSIYPQSMDSENKLSRELDYVYSSAMCFIKEYDFKLNALTRNFARIREYNPNFNVKRPIQFIHDVSQWMDLLELSHNLSLLNVYDEHGEHCESIITNLHSMYSELRDVRLKTLTRDKAIKYIELYDHILDVSGIYKDYGYARELDLIMCALKSRI